MVELALLLELWTQKKVVLHSVNDQEKEKHIAQKSGTFYYERILKYLYILIKLKLTL